MKSYTDIEQSKILERILPLSSADMGWNLFVDDTKRVLPIDDWALTKDGSGGVKFYHAWSLTALLEILHYPTLSQDFNHNWTCNSFGKEMETVCDWEPQENAVDAAYNMIIKLHERNLL